MTSIQRHLIRDQTSGQNIVDPAAPEFSQDDQKTHTFAVRSLEERKTEVQSPSTPLKTLISSSCVIENQSSVESLQEWETRMLGHLESFYMKESYREQCLELLQRAQQSLSCQQIEECVHGVERVIKSFNGRVGGYTIVDWLQEECESLMNDQMRLLDRMEKWLVYFFLNKAMFEHPSDFHNISGWKKYYQKLLPSSACNDATSFESNAYFLSDSLRISSIEALQLKCIEREIKSLLVSTKNKNASYEETKRHRAAFQNLNLLAELIPQELWQKYSLEWLHLGEVIAFGALHLAKLIKVYLPEGSTDQELLAALQNCAQNGDLEGLEMLFQEFPAVKNLANTLGSEELKKLLDCSFPSSLKWLKEQGVHLEGAASKIQVMEEMQTHVPSTLRKDDCRNYGGMQRHEIYLERQQAAITHLFLKLKEGIDFDQIIDLLGEWRRSVASKLNDSHADFFGKRREIKLYTRVLKDENNRELCHRIEQNLMKQITTVIAHSNGQTEELLLTKNEILNRWTSLYCWEHTSFQSMQKLLPHLGVLFNKLVSPCIDPQDAEARKKYIFQLGEFHWLWAHACPYVRGSAAIGEVLVLTLLTCQGITGVQLRYDAERFALSTPLQSDFAAEYECYLHFNPHAE